MYQLVQWSNFHRSDSDFFRVIKSLNFISCYYYNILLNPIRYYIYLSNIDCLKDIEKERIAGRIRIKKQSWIYSFMLITDITIRKNQQILLKPGPLITESTTTI